MIGRYAALLRAPYGMVICAGPTGSGKTTTLYGSLGEINSPERNVMTIEDPVEYRIPSINQIQINEQAGITFAGGLRSILRQDPDVILVGEIRDVETARIAVQSALTGHFVLSSLHATDAPSALHRLLDMGIESFLIASSVTAVARPAAGPAHLRPLPRCPTSRAAEELALLSAIGGRPPRSGFLRGQGCNFCAQTGYLERIGVYEMMPITDAIRDLIVDRATHEEIRKVARAEGMRTLQEEAARLVEAGVTTLGRGACARSMWWGAEMAKFALRRAGAGRAAPRDRRRRRPGTRWSSRSTSDSSARSAWSPRSAAPLRWRSAAGGSSARRSCTSPASWARSSGPACRSSRRCTPSARRRRTLPCAGCWPTSRTGCTGARASPTASTGTRGSSPPYYRGILRSAELTGQLDTVLDQLAKYLERDLEATAQDQAATIYPAMIAALALVHRRRPGRLRAAAVPDLLRRAGRRAAAARPGSCSPSPTSSLGWWWAVLGGVVARDRCSSCSRAQTTAAGMLRDRILLGLPIVGGHDPVRPGRAVLPGARLDGGRRRRRCPEALRGRHRLAAQPGLRPVAVPGQ